MVKLLKKTGPILLLFLISLLAGFYIFHFSFTEASSNTVEFVDDVKLDWDIATDIYIAAGSEAGSLEVSDSELSVEGIVNDGNPFSFLLKTSADRTVLQITPKTTTADFVFNSANQTNAYIEQWQIATTAEVNFVAGVEKTNNYYVVKVDGETYAALPSGSNAEVEFDHTGGGVYTIEETAEPIVRTLLPVDITDSSVTLRGNLINLQGAGSVDVWFEWGTNENLVDPESSEPESLISAGIFRATIINLVEGDTYYFRAVAENKEEELTGYGNILSFVAKEGLFIIVEMAGKTRFIQIDREGRIIIQKEL